VSDPDVFADAEAAYERAVADADYISWCVGSMRRTIPLDGCSLCNLPGVGGDIALLLPGIHG
jgi:hypothetical protein